MSKNHSSLIVLLGHILADTYALAVKTHAAHWNITGPHFFHLHDAFGAQYLALFTAADDVAERLRALDEKSPFGIHALAKSTSLKDISGTDGLALVKDLHAGHAHISALLVKGIAAAQADGDDGTADLLTARKEDHDKTAWMLKATLG
jgi:starvation-inducible DNA-binding protein